MFYLALKEGVSSVSAFSVGEEVTPAFFISLFFDVQLILLPGSENLQIFYQKQMTYIAVYIYIALHFVSVMYVTKQMLHNRLQIPKDQTTVNISVWNIPLLIAQNM